MGDYQTMHVIKHLAPMHSRFSSGLITNSAQELQSLMPLTHDNGTKK